MKNVKTLLLTAVLFLATSEAFAREFKQSKMNLTLKYTDAKKGETVTIGKIEGRYVYSTDGKACAFTIGDKTVECGKIVIEPNEARLVVTKEDLVNLLLANIPENDSNARAYYIVKNGIAARGESDHLFLGMSLHPSNHYADGTKIQFHTDELLFESVHLEQQIGFGQLIN